MKITITEETKSDYEQITKVHTLAFKRVVEARLEETQEKRVPQLSLVAEHENEIIGHILFYPIQIRTSG